MIRWFLALFSRRPNRALTPDMMPLVDPRLVRTVESDGDWQSGLIKELTGGQPFKVTVLESGWIEFVPEFRLRIFGRDKQDSRGL